jgi:dTDP-glucose pyrophosphorylase
MVVVGVIPAAGYATRLQPLRHSKEVVCIDGRPVMDYLVERMRLAPCSELRVVTRPEKKDVIENAERHGIRIVFARPDTVSASIVAGMQGLASDDRVLIGFPDTIWEPANGYSRLLSALAPGFDIALGLFQTKELERSDVVLLDDSGIVTGVQVKPEKPASDWIWGCCAARADALSKLESEPEPGAYFDSYSKSGRVLGIRLSDVWIDIGTKSVLEDLI